MEKALIITPFFKPNIGGAETFAEDLGKVLSKKYLVHICTIKWDKPIIWEGTDFIASFKLLLKLIPAVWKMRKNKYAKVYAFGFTSAFACVLLRIKFYAVICCLYDFNGRKFPYTQVLSRADKVFIEGKTGEADMLALGMKPEKVIKFQHWCEQGRFFPTKHTNKNLKVIFVGRPIWRKGKHIIEACQKLTKDVEYEYIENVPYKNLAVYYQMADVCVVPSLYSESFSRVVVEAASCGCVLITSNLGALPEMVSKFGYCIEPTPVKFAEIINNLNKNRWLLKRKKDETIIHAVTYFGELNASVFLL